MHAHRRLVSHGSFYKVPSPVVSIWSSEIKSICVGLMQDWRAISTGVTEVTAACLNRRVVFTDKKWGTQTTAHNILALTDAWIVRDSHFFNAYHNLYINLQGHQVKQKFETHTVHPSVDIKRVCVGVWPCHFFACKYRFKTIAFPRDFLQGNTQVLFSKGMPDAPLVF